VRKIPFVSAEVAAIVYENPSRAVWSEAVPLFPVQIIDDTKRLLNGRSTAGCPVKEVFFSIQSGLHHAAMSLKFGHEVVDAAEIGCRSILFLQTGLHD
jgi:hypothetical protein